MAEIDPKPVTDESNAVPGSGIPGSASPAHPSDGIPLPAHGFATLDDVDHPDDTTDPHDPGERDDPEDPAVRELGAIPAVEVITRAAVMLMSASAEKLGLAPDAPRPDLDEARRLITALAGLLAASQDQLGMHRQPLRDGLRTLQAAFREASSYPDAPGEGPGEKWLR